MPPEDLRNIEELAHGVRDGDRVALGRAITLVESRKDADRPAARALLELLKGQTGGAVRVGISGVPGVGKSTLIDALGIQLIDAGHRVAVLAVDPSSTVSGGSILGDKSRMSRLSRTPEAFVRPSPSATTLGGVARRTREAMTVCEAAGFDVVLVETVGVGQSETAVADMVDVFVVLLLPGGGDELQGIKKGILELADVVGVNKADGEREALAREAVRDATAALRVARAGDPAAAVSVSALSGAGLSDLWAAIAARRDALEESGQLEARRAGGRVRWMWTLVEEELAGAFRNSKAVADALSDTESGVRADQMTPEEAAAHLLGLFGIDLA